MYASPPKEDRGWEVGMMDMDQVIRRWLAGEKIRAIERSTGSDRNTVRRIVRLAEEGGIRGEMPWPDEFRMPKTGGHIGDTKEGFGDDPGAVN
jgi:hypothetical protein